MANTNMENFLDELNENETLREEFLAQSSMDGAYEVAKPYLGEMSEDDFSNEMIGIAKNIVEKDGLSDEMLASVQGGITENEAVALDTLKDKLLASGKIII